MHQPQIRFILCIAFACLALTLNAQTLTVNSPVTGQTYTDAVDAGNVAAITSAGSASKIPYLYLNTIAPVRCAQKPYSILLL